MKVEFLGGAGEVTGSCYRVEAAGARFLIDCGMFQGGRSADQRNRDALAFDPGSIDFVLLTHAHIDHSGLLPRLARLGYAGPIHCTDATADLLSVMLPDSAHVQQHEALWQERNRRRHPGTAEPAFVPLYTIEDATAALALLRPLAYDREFEPSPRIGVRFRDAGHILGSAIVEVSVRRPPGEFRLVVSGDLGMRQAPLLRDPFAIERADWLLVESTYGNRLHRSLAETSEELSLLLDDTLVRRGGNVVFPAFAVGRTQSILCVLADLVRSGRAPRLEVFVDSPMATAATDVTRRHRNLLDPESRALLDWMDTRPAQFRVRFVADTEASKALNAIRGGAVIISASGMCDAGRIKHHLQHNLPRATAAVVITGFQAAGTLGRRLVDGADSVRLFREDVPVRASIHTIGGLSAHADRAGLLDWLGGFAAPPSRTFVVHGEPEVSADFAATLRRERQWPSVEVPQQGDVFEMQ